VSLGQTYAGANGAPGVSTRLLMQQSRYAHARQPQRDAGCTRKLRTALGRVIRQIERQQAGRPARSANL
jgi:hypothetical protein